MFCPQCGSEIKNGAAFCASCGSKLTQINQNQDASKASTGSLASGKQPRKRFPFIIGAIGIVAVLAVGGVLVYQQLTKGLWLPVRTSITASYGPNDGYGMSTIERTYEYNDGEIKVESESDASSLSRTFKEVEVFSFEGDACVISSQREGSAETYEMAAVRDSQKRVIKVNNLDGFGTGIERALFTWHNGKDRLSSVEILANDGGSTVCEYNADGLPISCSFMNGDTVLARQEYSYTLVEEKDDITTYDYYAPEATYDDGLLKGVLPSISGQIRVDSNGNIVYSKEISSDVTTEITTEYEYITGADTFMKTAMLVAWDT